jgi:hypothetical protein
MATYLSPEHLRRLREIDKVPAEQDAGQDENLELAPHLLGLATVFVRYSSAAVFGTETDSPQTLR